MLKNVLSLLLSKFYSKQESGEVAHQAMPSSTSTIITPSITSTCNTWSDSHQGVAPADGYFFATGLTMEPQGLLQIRSDVNSLGVTTYASPLKDIRLVFPVTKGTSLIVSADKVKNITLRFVSTIGGGYRDLEELILQGGGQCLKVWYSSLRKSSLSVKRNGSDIRAPQRLEELQTQLLQLHLQEIGKILLRRLMVTFGSAAFPQKFFWTMAVFGKVWRTTFITTKALLSLSQKGQPSGTTSTLTVKDFTQGLKRTTLLNSAVGGASC